MKVLDKVCVITGAGTGMGRYLAILLSARGAHIAMCDVNSETLEITKAMAMKTRSSTNVKITTHITDVSSEASVKAFRDEVLQQHGGKVHILLNNAGIQACGAMVYAPDKTAEDIEQHQKNWERCFNVNFWGVVHCTRAFLPTIIAQNEGFILNTSSVNGFYTWPEHASYSASKGAVKMFTESLLCELEMKHPHVKVCCIHPGGIKTEIFANANYIVKDQAQFQKMKGVVQDGMFSLSAEEAAEWIIQGIEHNKSRLLVGYDAIGLDIMMRVLPRWPYLIFKTLGELGVKSLHPDDHEVNEQVLNKISTGPRLLYGGGWAYVLFLGWTLPIRIVRTTNVMRPALALGALATVYKLRSSL